MTLMQTDPWRLSIRERLFFAFFVVPVMSSSFFAKSFFFDFLSLCLSYSQESRAFLVSVSVDALASDVLVDDSPEVCIPD